MNTDELPPKKTDSRLKRIKEVSRRVQLVIGLLVLLEIYLWPARMFHWPFLGEGTKIFVSEGHVYSSLKEMPSEVSALWLVKLGLGAASTVVLFALFQLYARGILFSAKNVLFIRFLGYWMIINWFIDLEMQDRLHDASLSMTPVFVGFLIIFLAWIMDEGRKIQEEQELTV